MKHVLLTSVGVMALLGLAVLGGARFKSRATRALATARSSVEAVPVRTAIVRRGSVYQRVRLTGDVEPFARVQIAPKVQGRIDLLRLDNGAPVTEGTAVTKGARLATIDQDAVTAQLNQAEAALLAAKAALQQADTQAADSERELKRAQALYSNGQGAATRQMLDKAETTHQMAQAQRAAAGAQIKQAEAALELARINLRESTVLAPMDGVIAEKRLDEGNLVSPGVPILTLLQVQPVKVMINVPQRHVGQLVAGQTQVRIDLDAYGHESLTATIGKVHPQADAATRTVPVEILQPNADRRLIPGMYACVTLTLGTRENVLVAPADALLRRQDKQTAFIVQGDTAREREVSLGMRDGNLVEVLSGLQEGDVLVITGQDRLLEGTKVRQMAGDAQ